MEIGRQSASGYKMYEMKVFSEDGLLETIVTIMMAKSRNKKPFNDEKAESRVFAYNQNSGLSITIIYLLSS
ncbi:hypothetical protein GTG28_06465 [Vibrio sp. OCN044]|uniref:Uncharacterized protein n=1 Tax=Vibrio tetraodonis subsp. pristinus TaxID=2695891 RepID=A0A6L8M083_9VIBR|nr:hypothetical protein [Vibrio tetraodonis]MYM58862.1 hypothetical protein [Vibrio tetraodonis subsp. pristinus]